MKFSKIYFAVGVVTTLGACGQQTKPVDVAPITQEDESLKKDETSLFSTRGALQRERKQLVDEREELAAKRKTVEPTDRATAAALADQESSLMKKENDLVNKEGELSKKLDSLLAQREQLVEKATVSVASAPAASADSRAAAREQAVATREKDVARREGELATREQTLAQRERDLAHREKETCGVAPAPIMMAAPKVELPKGLKYTQHDVEPLYQKAMKTMQEHGLLAGDLPGHGRLADETRAAMKEGDYMRAKYDADQLLAEVQGVTIDRGFISAKMARLSDAMKGKGIAADAKKQVDALFQEATTAYGDGKFSLANQKINRLYSLLK